MADLQQQLQSILQDPEAMGQISALAGALTGVPPPGETAPEPEDNAQPDLSALLSSLGMRGSTGPDPALLETAMKLLNEYNAPNDDKSALMEALTPYLSQSRQEKLARAEQAARLSRVVRSAFHLWQEGGHV